jgi:hypothetical protein
MFISSMTTDLSWNNKKSILTIALTKLKVVVHRLGMYYISKHKTLIMKKQLILTCLVSVSFFVAPAQYVGIGTNSPQATLHIAGNQMIDTTLTFGIIGENLPPMINMFRAGTQNKPRMVLAHSPTYTNWGLQYVDSTDKFHLLSGGTAVLTADLGLWRVGIGRPDPAVRLDIQGTGSYNLAASEGDFRLGDETYRLKMGVASAGGGAGDAYVASSHRLFLGAGTTLGTTQTMSVNSNGRVGIGTFSPSARLKVVGDTITIPVVEAIVAYNGNAHVRGISSSSTPADGWGYGVYSTGGYRGGYFIGDGGTSTGTSAGVQGFASGSGGVRYGVYGSASGGTESWGGYFPTKTYTNELRVGTTNGATGYLVSVGGKLIAEDVKVLPEASWPDYVFNKAYKLMSLEELEAAIAAQKHLPGIPSANEIKEEGIMLGMMQVKTMEKVEENTLYIIQLNNRIKELEKAIEELIKKIK